jgi:hypothetical protein
MLRIILSLVVVLFVAGCGKDSYTNTVTQVPGPVVTLTPPPIPVTDLQADINALVADENAYREGLGQTGLTNGLGCVLYTVTGGQFIQNDASHNPTLTGLSQVASFLLADVINQPNSPVSDGLNVLPLALRSNVTYQNLILLRCQGQIVVTTTGYYGFDLWSDDGSVLYVDGARVIDNDGGHGIVEKHGSKYLRRGVHAFRLDFAQTGAGNQALILKANGDFIQGQFYFH